MSNEKLTITVALREAERCRLASNPTLNEDVIVTLADEVKRLGIDIERYDSAIAQRDIEIERLRTALKGPQQMTYEVVIRSHLGDLERAVNTFLKAGWRPQGSICVYSVGGTEYKFVQALIKDEL